MLFLRQELLAVESAGVARRVSKLVIGADTTTSGTGPGTIAVTVDGEGLSADQYDGLITVTSGDTSAEVSVRLLVRPPAPANLVIHPRAFNFIMHPDGPPPASKTLHVKSAGHGELDWMAEASTSDGDWLLIPSTTSDSGTTPDTIELTVDPNGLEPGHYTGMVEVSAGDQTKTARVFLRIVGQPGSGDNGDGEPPTANQTAVQISPPVINFTATNGTTAPASVDVRLHSRLSGLTFTATASTSSGGEWLIIDPDPAMGEIPGTINVSATPGDLPTGIYIGLVMLEIDGTVMEERSIPVVLRIGTPAGLPRLRTRPGAVVFRATESGEDPAAAEVEVTAHGAFSIPFETFVSTRNGGSWLSVVPPSGGTAPASVSVEVDIAGLAPGRYRGAVVFLGTGATPTTLKVVLLVSPAVAEESTGAPPTMALSRTLAGAQQAAGLEGEFLEPPSAFIATAQLPLEVQVLVTDSAAAPVEGAEVLVASSNLEPEFTLDDLGAGVYSGVFRSLSEGPVALTAVATQGGTSSPPFGVGGDLEGSSEIIPAIFPGGAVSAASFAPDPTPVAPGSLVSLFGLDLVPATAVAASQPLPRELAGVKVLVGGIEAPLLAVLVGDDGSSQITFQIPVELAGLNYADVVVNNNGLFSAPQGIHLWPALPALFTRSGTGTGTVAALHGDFQAVTTERPAISGDTILLYATGLGETSPPQVSGEPAAGAAPATGNVTVTIGGRSATVHYAGAAPGFVGLYQINVAVPHDLQPGDVAVEVTVGGIGSGEGVTLPIAADL